MAKKLSASSQPGKLTRMSAADILKLAQNRTAKDEKRLRHLAEMPDSEIDYSDIPPATPEQLARMVPAPEFWKARKKQVTLRVDADVLAWFQQSGKGYLTKMNDALRRVMLAEGAPNVQKPPSR